MQDLRLQQNTKRTQKQQSLYRYRGTADQFCVLQSKYDGSRTPSVAMEYKLPLKLRAQAVSVGLKQGIQTYKDLPSQAECSCLVAPSSVEVQLA